jgi:VIT1/CCC1 family predicted Fe2+/Mn2+ transporter
MERFMSQSPQCPVAPQTHSFVRKLFSPESVRSVFTGLNDGLVGTLGGISGLFAVFHTPSLVLLATLIEAVAGAMSMSIGAFVAVDCEEEIARARRGSNVADPSSPAAGITAYVASWLVGLSYMAGAILTSIPLFFGVNNPWWCWLTAGVALAAVSGIIARFSGMRIRKRIVLNVILLFGAAAATFAIGKIAHCYWGVDA